MPELPEVETVARHLLRHLPGRRVLSVWTSGLRLRRPVPRRALAALRGARFAGVRRRGKYLLLDLRGRGGAPRSLLVHLGMSGRLILEESPARPRHTHVAIALSRGALRLTDPRRFGLVRVGDGGAFAELARLGVDPFEPAMPARLLAACRATRRAVKDVLLDQGVIAGVGNIYACEALHRAGIDPRRRARGLAPDRVARLARAVVEALRAGIDHRGTTLRDFVGGDGAPGEHVTALRVYRRDGLPCPACGAAVRAVRQGARSTFLCPRCQR